MYTQGKAGAQFRDKPARVKTRYVEASSPGRKVVQGQVRLNAGSRKRACRGVSG